ncbi:MAG TPA: tetratricopeptide repeat protein [Terriglobia bacterium]
MPERHLRVLLLAQLLLPLFPSTLWPQAIPHPEAPSSELRGVEQDTWHVFGKVTDLKGAPIRQASVRVDLGYGLKLVKNLTTDVQGQFSTEYTLDASTVKSLAVSLLVTREGFHPAREFVDFGAKDSTWQINVMMRPDTESEDDLPVESLINRLAPRLRSGLEGDPSIAGASKDFERGTHDFLDQRDSASAIPSLTKVVKRYPDCGRCRILLGLAMLDAGSWNGATREFVEAYNLAANGAKVDRADMADSLLLVAELENWKGNYNKAAGFLMQAKDLDPKNAFILQELGRTLVFQKNWEAADVYLGQAVDAGASKDALLLRSRALLEEGDPEAADAALKAYLGGASLKTFPVSVRRLDSQIEDRLKLRTYAKAQSVVSEPLPVLIESIPELQGIEPASSQADLAAILEKAGENVKSFFSSFQNTVSIEQIREERLAKDGKIKDSLDQKFQYLLLTRPEKWGLGLEEYRTDFHGDRTAATGLDSGLMLTSGFASASLLFHPAYQSGATFRYLGRQTASGLKCYVVAFAQTPEKAQMVERFNTSGDSVLVLFQGLAWVDADTYRIIRLRTDLLKPQTAIRLQRQTTEITYDPVHFKQVASALWLPSEVAVTVQWAGKTYRNMHKYSDFKLFNAETLEKQKPLDVPSPERGTEQP